MVSSIEIILIPTLMIFLGYALKRLDILKAQDSTTLSKIVINVSMPALIFTNLVTANISIDMIILPITSIIVSLICMTIAFLFCKSRGYSKIKTWTLMIASAMMNTGFVGYPITLGVFGNEGLINAIFFDLSTSIIFVVYGMVLVSQFGGDRKEVVKSGLSFMPLWAVIFGLIFNIGHIQYGYVLNSALTYLANSTVPLIMISLGLTIDFKGIKDYLSDSLVVSAIRLVIAPVIVFVALSALNVTGLIFKVAVLESGMSTAMTALVLSITYGLDNKLMSSCIFIDILLSLISLTCVITVLT
ncbi:MAG: AEC family transporter [Methanosphaera sp.]